MLQSVEQLARLLSGRRDTTFRQDAA